MGVLSTLKLLKDFKLDFELPDDPLHPLQVALRTYVLALSLATTPSLIPILSSFLTSKSRSHSNQLSALYRVLARELRLDSFAFAVTLSVAGGSFLNRALLTSTSETVNPRDDQNATGLQPFLKRWNLNIPPIQQTFLSYILSSSLGILLIQRGRQRLLLGRTKRPNQPPARSPTLDLTLLLLVRALDMFTQRAVSRFWPDTSLDTPLVGESTTSPPTLPPPRRPLSKAARSLTSHIDAGVFWACSARIMWCFCYEPERLPRSYVRWINTLANLDGRMIYALQLIRKGLWSYERGSPNHSQLLVGLAKDMKLPPEWGNPASLPARGLASAEAWNALGVTSRFGRGGLPCEIVHSGVGSSIGLAGSCHANVTLRFLKAFVEALAIYIPVHLLPVLLTRPQRLASPHHLMKPLMGATRSATFLSSFIAIFWYTVCFTRTIALARLFPGISHDFWDGPFGCVLASCLACGTSIWIESGRRRGEMALYVLPRALRACLPGNLVRTDLRASRIIERIVFVLSISSLLTAAVHSPEYLRGLSRWTLAFVINGPNAGFWKQKREVVTSPPTPKESD